MDLPQGRVRQGREQETVYESLNFGASKHLNLEADDTSVWDAQALLLSENVAFSKGKI